MDRLSLHQTPVSADGTVAAKDLMVVVRARRVRRHLRVLGFIGKLAAVAAVLGLFVLVAFPFGFVRFPCRSKQSEAKGNLKALYVAQEAYGAEHDVYSDDPDVIGFEPKGAKLRYRYAITDVSGEGRSATFRAWAIADLAVAPELEGDVWAISERNDLVNLQNGCEQ